MSNQPTMGINVVDSVWVDYMVDKNPSGPPPICQLKHGKSTTLWNIICHFIVGSPVAPRYASSSNFNHHGAPLYLVFPGNEMHPTLTTPCSSNFTTLQLQPAKGFTKFLRTWEDHDKRASCKKQKMLTRGTRYPLQGALASVAPPAFMGWPGGGIFPLGLFASKFISVKNVDSSAWANQCEQFTRPIMQSRGITMPVTNVQPY